VQSKARGGDIGLADAAVAFTALRPDPRAIPRIAALLGFDSRPKQTVQGPQPEEDSPATEDVSAGPSDKFAPTVSAPRLDVGVTEQVPAEGEWHRHLTPVGRELSSARPLAIDLLDAVESPLATIDFLPLIASRYTARVVQAAVATDTRDGDLDLDEVVDAVAARRPLSTWPTRPNLAMFRGVQLLIDTSESMMVFARDCRNLADAFRETVGDHLVDEMAFSCSPLTDAGLGPRWMWRPYSPPPPSTPVVVLSDLNIPQRNLGGIDTDGWLQLRDLLIRRGSPLVVFVPFPPDRWPPRLRRNLPLVQWDRGTSASGVIKAMMTSGR